jgi:hypothetical protein
MTEAIRRIIIVKYISIYLDQVNRKELPWHENDSAGGWTLEQLGLKKENYPHVLSSLQDAIPIIKGARDLNPSVDYGLVDLDRNRVINFQDCIDGYLAGLKIIEKDADEYQCTVCNEAGTIGAFRRKLKERISSIEDIMVYASTFLSFT